MPLHVRNAPRSPAEYLIIILNILAVVAYRLLFALATMDEPWGERIWEEDAASYILTKSSRRGLVSLIKFITAYLVIFSISVLAGFDWLEVEELWDVWGPADLRGDVFRGPLWFW